MAIKLVWHNRKNKTQDITEYVGTITWSGAHNAAAREVSFTVLNNPYDKNFSLSNQIKNADKIYLMSDNKVLFYGLICDVQRTSEIGTVDFLARDMLYNLLNSTTSGRYKKKTAEYITRSICNDFNIKQGTITATKYQIKKLIIKDKSPYEIIKKVYKRAQNEKTKKPYFIHMDGDKLCVTERGLVATKSGKSKEAIVLKDSECVYEAQFEEDASTVIDKVRVINQKRRLVNLVKDKKLIKKWGVIQHVLQVDKGKGTKQAKAEIAAPERSASISAIGQLKALAGYKIKIKDEAAGLTGTYLIINDTHTFENGIHLMSLDLYLKGVEKHPTVIQIDDLSYSTWKTRKIKCVFYKYYATGNDARGKKRAVGVTCAAPPSVPFGTKFTYKGKTYKVTDRHSKAKFKKHLYYIGILAGSKKEADKFKPVTTKITITNPKPTKKTKKKSDASEKGSDKAHKLVEYALSFRGKVRYSMGAKNVPGGVADCSGFVSYCVGKFGIPGGDTRHFAVLGQSVSKAQARAGDIIVFQGTYRPGPSHVGIMIDNVNFVHSSSGAGGVTVTSRNNPYHAAHFHSIRRVL